MRSPCRCRVGHEGDLLARLSIPLWLSLLVAPAFALVACTSPARTSKSDVPSVEQRLSDLERRIEVLEARPPLEPPYRNRAEIEAHIQALEAERATLLTRYLAEHPAIRDIDRRLSILNTQLKMIE